MKSLDGYMRAALSLRELSVDEQVWLLDQLEEDERLRIGEALQALRDAEIEAAVRAREPAPEPESKSPLSLGPDADYATVLNHADSNMLAEILIEQPDWATAFVVAEYPKNDAVQRLVGQLSLDRMDRLRNLAKHVRAKTKPKVRAAVLGAVAEQLKQRVQLQSEAMEFAFVLGRVASQG